MINDGSVNRQRMESAAAGNIMHTIIVNGDRPFRPECGGRWTDYTLEQHLNSFYNDKNYSRLWDTWRSDKDEYTQRLANIPLTFPEYSSHGADHSEKIIQYIEMLLGGERIRILSPTDTWLLLQCAYTHDLGMCVGDAEKKQIFRNKEFRKSKEFQRCLDELSEKLAKLPQTIQDALNFWKKRSDDIPEADETYDAVLGNGFSLAQLYRDQLITYWFRSKHARRSAEIVREESEKHTHNSIFPHRLRSIIADIIVCHGLNFDSVCKLPYCQNGFYLDKIHPRFAAALLRMGDLLDLDSNRFNPFLLESVDERNYESVLHQFKHLSVREYLVNEKTIEVTSHFHTDETKRFLVANKDKGLKCSGDDVNDCMIRSVHVTQDWHKMIYEETNNFHLSWDEITPVGFPDVIAKAKKENLRIFVDEYSTDSREKHMRYSISVNRAAHIIEGSELYRHPLTFMREIIQNAIDATKQQLYLDLKRRWDKHCKSPSYPMALVDIGHRLEDYAVKIELELLPESFPDELVVTVADCGVGISSERLQKMRQIGDIADFSSELDDMPEWMRPTADFGIGMQSVFWVVDRFWVESRPHKNENDKDMQRKIIFNSTRIGGDIFNMELVASKKAEEAYPFGTKVIVHIDLNQKNRFMSYFLPQTKVGGSTGRNLKLYVADVFMQEAGKFLLETFAGELIPIKISFKGTQFERMSANENQRGIYFKAPDLKPFIPVINPEGSALYLEEDGAIFFWYNPERRSGNSKEICVGLRLKKSAEKKTEFFFRGISFNDDIGEHSLFDLLYLPGYQCQINIMYGKAGDIIEVSRDRVRKDALHTLWRELRDCFKAFYEQLYMQILELLIKKEAGDNEAGGLLERLESFTEGSYEYLYLHCTDSNNENENIIREWIIKHMPLNTQSVFIFLRGKERKLIFDTRARQWLEEKPESMYYADIYNSMEGRELKIISAPLKCEALYAAKYDFPEVLQLSYSSVIAFDTGDHWEPVFKVFKLTTNGDALPEIDVQSYKLLLKNVIYHRKHDISGHGFVYPVFPACRFNSDIIIKELVVSSVPANTTETEVDRYESWVISPVPLDAFEFDKNTGLYKCKKEDMTNSFTDVSKYPDYPALVDFIKNNALKPSGPFDRRTDEGVKEAYKIFMQEFLS